MKKKLVLETLRRDGIAYWPYPFAEVGAFAAHLAACPVYPGHVRKGVAAVARDSASWLCHDMHDVMRAPGFFEIALGLTELAAEYLGQPAWLYSFNAFHTMPTPIPKADIQAFHRDADDTDFLVLFLYVTNVHCLEHGPHQFLAGSHRGANTGDVISVLGDRGTLFFAATKGLHRGMVPERGSRCVAWARWGVSPVPAAYCWDGNMPLPRSNLGRRYPLDPALQEAIELVAK